MLGLSCMLPGLSKYAVHCPVRGSINELLSFNSGFLMVANRNLGFFLVHHFRISNPMKRPRKMTYSEMQFHFVLILRTRIHMAIL